MEPPDDQEPEFIEPDPGTPDHYMDEFQYTVIGTCRALYPFDGTYLFNKASAKMNIQEKKYFCTIIHHYCFQIGAFFG